MKYNTEIAEILAERYLNVADAEFVWCLNNNDIYHKIIRITRDLSECILCQDAKTLRWADGKWADSCRYCIYNHPAIRRVSIESVCKKQKTYINLKNCESRSEGVKASHARGRFINRCLNKIQAWNEFPEVK